MRIRLERIWNASAQLGYKLDLPVDAVHVRKDSNIAVPVSLDHVLGELRSEFAELAQLLKCPSRRHDAPAQRAEPPGAAGEILRNLIRNAIRTHRRADMVTCRRRGVAVHIGVCDTGIGIRPDQLTRIFDAFQLFN